MGIFVKVISWNVRGLNCPVKRGDVKWVLRKYACDVAILQESKMEEVGRDVVVSLWVVAEQSGGICHLWAGREASSSYGILKFWRLRTPGSDVFRCAVNLRPCMTVLFRASLEFMVLMMTGRGVLFLRSLGRSFLVRIYCGV